MSAGTKLTLDLIRARLQHYLPKTLKIGEHRHAAVAMILRPAHARVEVLLIQRARSEGDPWSGQMAFPGGIVEVSDADARAAAERETREEIGLRLRERDYLGRIDDMQGRHRGHPSGIVVSAFAYAVNQDFIPEPNYEVSDVLWVPLNTFIEPRRRVEIRHPSAPNERFPGIRVSDDADQVVWGLTRRFVNAFFCIVDDNLAGRIE